MDEQHDIVIIERSVAVGYLHSDKELDTRIDGVDMKVL